MRPARLLSYACSIICFPVGVFSNIRPADTCGWHPVSFPPSVIVQYCREPTECGEWIGGLANMWRTTGDIQATWESMMSNIHSQNDMAPVARVGSYNDPDMLLVGDVGLSLVEQRSHFSLWCIAAAPLLAGTDIVHASNDTLAILTAAGPLSVNEVGAQVIILLFFAGLFFSR